MPAHLFSGSLHVFLRGSEKGQRKCISKGIPHCSRSFRARKENNVPPQLTFLPASNPSFLHGQAALGVLRGSAVPRHPERQLATALYSTHRGQHEGLWAGTWQGYKAKAGSPRKGLSQSEERRGEGQWQGTGKAAKEGAAESPRRGEHGPNGLRGQGTGLLWLVLAFLIFLSSPASSQLASFS